MSVLVERDGEGDGRIRYGPLLTDEMCCSVRERERALPRASLRRDRWSSAHAELRRDGAAESRARGRRRPRSVLGGLDGALQLDERAHARGAAEQVLLDERADVVGHDSKVAHGTSSGHLLSQALHHVLLLAWATTRRRTERDGPHDPPIGG